MTARKYLWAAVTAAALTLAGNGVASADSGVLEANNADFLVGDTLYFSDWLGATTCAITADGNVGCDLGPGSKLWGVLPITDMVIDSSFLPAHPTFGLTGRHGQPGSRWLTDVPRPDGNVYAGTRFDYAGATCLGGQPRGAALTCSSKGHTFTLGQSATIS